MSESANTTPKYRRLAGQNGAPMTNSSLWLADDHMLQISSSNGIQETYQRFYYRDIKTLLITESSSGAVLSVVFGFFSVIFFLGAAITTAKATENDARAAITLWILFAISFVPTLLFLIRGRARKVYVLTELQTVYWPSIARQWQADKLIEQIDPLIKAAQVDLVAAPTPVAPPLPTQQPQETTAPAPEGVSA